VCDSVDCSISTESSEQVGQKEQQNEENKNNIQHYNLSSLSYDISAECKSENNTIKSHQTSYKSEDEKSEYSEGFSFHGSEWSGFSSEETSEGSQNSSQISLMLSEESQLSM
jgi:hypothetical protein